MGIDRIEYMKRRFPELEKKIKVDVRDVPSGKESTSEDEIGDLIPTMDTLREWDRDVKSSRLGLNSDEI